ncbi:hypothetical protein TUMEXPCC7403_02835 [Tumidithrix helvetica PCC 7403]
MIDWFVGKTFLGLSYLSFSIVSTMQLYKGLEFL